MLPKIRVTHSGLRLMAITSAQAATTLTLGDDNSSSRVIRLMCEPGTTQSSFAYVALGQVGSTSDTCTSANLLVTSNEQVFVDSRGFTAIKVLSQSGTAFVNVTPLENID